MAVVRNKFYVYADINNKRIVCRLEENSHTRQLTVDNVINGKLRIFIISTWSLEELQSWLKRSKYFNTFTAEFCTDIREV